MAAPRKPKSAGVQKEKTRTTAAKSPVATVASAVASSVPAAATEPPTATVSPAANGNGLGTQPADVIRARAYEIFLQRSGRSGDELSDWLAAEREIMGHFRRIPERDRCVAPANPARAAQRGHPSSALIARDAGC